MQTSLTRRPLPARLRFWGFSALPGRFKGTSCKCRLTPAHSCANLLCLQGLLHASSPLSVLPSLSPLPSFLSHRYLSSAPSLCSLPSVPYPPFLPFRSIIPLPPCHSIPFPTFHSLPAIPSLPFPPIPSLPFSFFRSPVLPPLLLYLPCPLPSKGKGDTP